jgi:hypothetical protein
MAHLSKTPKIAFVLRSAKKEWYSVDEVLSIMTEAEYTAQLKV